MNKYSEISKQKTEQSIREWFVAPHGDELYLLGLFFSSGSLQMHRFIIEKSKRLKGRNIYFSRDNVNPPSETFRIWNKRTWASDGSLKCVRFGGDKTIGLVEFKATYNRYLKHNDIAKLIQYLYYSASHKKYLLWFCRRTMVKDILWISDRFLNNKIDSNFFDVCNTYKVKGYATGPALSDLEKKIKEKQIEAITAPKETGVYHAKSFRTFITSNKEILKEGIKNFLVLINYDTESVDNKGKAVPEIINLKTFYKRKDNDETEFQKHIEYIRSL